MPDRSTEAQLSDREAAALELLAAGTGTAIAAQQIAERYGVSLRTAQRSVRVAAFELVEPLTGHELDTQAMLSLYRLELLAGRHIESDPGLSIRATKAHASALAALRRAIESAAPKRLKLRHQTSRASVDPF
jgi:predicted DNA-binding transcriptional regulator YafY